MSQISNNVVDTRVLYRDRPLGTTLLVQALCIGLIKIRNCRFFKFIYSEKATKFCEISTVDLTGTTYIGQIYGGDFTKICGLLRIYEFYLKPYQSWDSITSLNMQISTIFLSKRRWQLLVILSMLW